ncbi:Uncharacterised protein [Mycobacteroides abscessus subsp. abscessus]|nr:Uncharacterised protein [Mycobacteroides abscessus subsp. abscessus]
MDFPEPLGPSRATVSPRAMRRLKFRSASDLFLPRP